MLDALISWSPPPPTLIILESKLITCTSQKSAAENCQICSYQLMHGLNETV